MKALVIGATGLVGTQLVTQLINEFQYTEIVLFVRKKISLKHPKLKQFVIDFNHINEYANQINGDVLFSCLGTTIKKAKTKQNQYLIDYTYQYNFAKIAADNNVRKYVLISSMGSNNNANNFYTKMKGELEDAVKKLPFKYIYIIRPSLLLGNRKEFRLGEKTGIVLFKLFSFIIPTAYQGILDYEVAKTMVYCSLALNNKKVNIVTNKMMINKNVQLK